MWLLWIQTLGELEEDSFFSKFMQTGEKNNKNRCFLKTEEKHPEVEELTMKVFQLNFGYFFVNIFMDCLLCS